MKLLLLACSLLAPSILPAQTFYGSIVGTVTDASSAAVPGAAVTLINTGISERRMGLTEFALRLMY